jgi:hypothetical protein
MEGPLTAAPPPDNPEPRRARVAGARRARVVGRVVTGPIGLGSAEPSESARMTWWKAVKL